MSNKTDDVDNSLKELPVAKKRKGSTLLSLLFLILSIFIVFVLTTGYYIKNPGSLSQIKDWIQNDSLLKRNSIPSSKASNNPVKPLFDSPALLSWENKEFYIFRVDKEIQKVSIHPMLDERESPISFDSLLINIENKYNSEIVFATNAGIFKKGYFPLGLFVSEREELSPINVDEGRGNFFLKPNGVFSISSNDFPEISATESFINHKSIEFATQSGPLLLSKGEIHPAFNKDSKNVFIRSGVGIDKNGDIIFALSKQRVNFYDFASFFQYLGCNNALYLDGAISEFYLPELQKNNLSRNFSALIIVTEKNHEAI